MSCESLCTASEYFETNKSECIPCHYSCLTCKAAGNSGCLECAEGFSFNN